ncbi:hypothetical protein C5167_001717 [Papaver somniferum]|uniref:CSN8/PSMD8/EIF3K domain-containing protein n=1 Tax=Papaver somniferum TaxID=3469 RepID=A0A4Y7KY90_PAPSO|nr:hypothetical protein C5167_001717 [Papaver somniferum]
MDFSPLKKAIEAKSYEKMADIFDELMLQVTSQGIAYQEEWPYAIHLLGHIYVKDINSARFLWKLIPSNVKENQLEVVAACKIGQKLWLRDYAGVYEAIRGFNWSPAAQGMSEEEATNYAAEQGWLVDSTSGMLIVKKQHVVKEQKLDHTKLQRLTEYVFHLEH